MLRASILLLAACSVLAINHFASGSVDASHPFEGAGQVIGDRNYLYRNLEAIYGNGTIFYRLCGNPYGVPDQWGIGVDNWDNAIGGQFNPVSCGSTAQTELRWEVGPAGAECGAGAWACWLDPAGWGLPFTTHGSHRDLTLGVIVFVRDAWTARPNDQWRVYISAHEWGHNMSLADHRSSDCAENTLMLNYTAGTLPPNPCNQSPTANDAYSVHCNVYKLCAGVRVAAGDVLAANGCDEIITAPGPGPDSWVRVWGPLVGCDWTSGVVLVAQFLAYGDSGWQGGVHVAAGNVDSSTAVAEIITGADAGGGADTRVWRVSGTSAVLLTAVDTYPGFSGGVRVGAGNLDCSGADEVLTAPGPGNTFVKTWRYVNNTLSFYGQFEPYSDSGWQGGVFVAGGNLSSDCGDEMDTGPDSGGGPDTRAWRSAWGGRISAFCAYGCSFTGGVRVGAGNHDSDSWEEIITGPGAGGFPDVRVYNADGSGVAGFIVYDLSWSKGVYVAGGNIDGTGKAEVITGYGGEEPRVKAWRCCTAGQATQLVEFNAW